MPSDPGAARSQREGRMAKNGREVYVEPMDLKTKEVTAILELLPQSTRLLFLRQLAEASSAHCLSVPVDVSPTRATRYRNPHHVWNNNNNNGGSSNRGPGVSSSSNRGWLDARASSTAPVKSRPITTPTTLELQAAAASQQGASASGQHEGAEPPLCQSTRVRSKSAGSESCTRPQQPPIPHTCSKEGGGGKGGGGGGGGGRAVAFLDCPVNHTRGCVCCAQQSNDDYGNNDCHTFSAPTTSTLGGPSAAEFAAAASSPWPVCHGQDLAPKARTKDQQKLQVMRVLRRWQRELVPPGLSTEEARKINGMITKVLRDMGVLKRIIEKLGRNFGVASTSLCLLRHFSLWRLATHRRGLRRAGEEKDLLVTVSARLAQETEGLASKLVQVKGLWQAWLAWRYNACLRGHHMNIARNVRNMVRRTRLRRLRTSFETWRKNAKVKRALRRLKERYVRRSQLRRMSMVLAELQSLVQRKRLERHRIAVMRKRSRDRVLSSAMSCWCVVVEHARAQHSEIGRAINRMRRGQLAQAFNQWLSFIESRREAHAALGSILHRIMHHSLGAAFNRWVEFVAERRRSKHLLARAMRRLNVLVLLRAFNTWAQLTLKMRTAKKVAATVLRRMQNQTMVTAFNKWAETTRENRRRRSILARAVTRICTFHAAAAFDAWKDYVRRIKRARKLAMKAIARMGMQTLRRAFLAWRMAPHMTPEPSVASADDFRRCSLLPDFDDGDRMEKAAMMRNYRLANNAFTWWQEYTVYRVQLRVVEEQLWRKWRVRVLRSVFVEMKEAMFRNRARRQQLLLSGLTRYAKKQVLLFHLERWKKGVLRDRNRRLLAVTAAAREECARWEAVHNAHVQTTHREMSAMLSVEKAAELKKSWEEQLQKQQQKAQRCGKLVTRLVAVVWYQSHTARIFTAWRLQTTRASHERMQMALRRAEQALSLMVRELHAESINRKLLEDSMGRIVSERTDDASRTRQMLEEFERQFSDMKRLVRPSLTDFTGAGTGTGSSDRDRIISSEDT